MYLKSVFSVVIKNKMLSGLLVAWWPPISTLQPMSQLNPEWRMGELFIYSKASHLCINHIPSGLLIILFNLKSHKHILTLRIRSNYQVPTLPQC